MLRTRITELLGIEHPVLLAGMGGVSYSALAAAVSAAGGLGCLGASTMPPDELDAQMAAIRAVTDRPFAVDLLTAFPGDMVAQVEAVIAGGARAFVAGLGIPTAVIDLCHRHDVIVMSMCGKVDHAVRAADAGVDVVIAQGTEAGGHTGLVATLPLVPQVVDAVGGRIPVVAAGGISDGRGLAAALSLGADAVWVGTRFIATPEANTVTGYKESLVAAHETDTTITKAYSGKPMRTLANDWTRHHDAHPEEVSPFPDQIGAAVMAGALHLGLGPEATGVDVATACFPAGQGVGAIGDVVPAGELVRRFVADAEAALGAATRHVVTDAHA